MNISIREVHYIPTFEGKHNSLRSKVWLVLFDNALGGGKGLRLNELASKSGAGYHSLAVSLTKWIKWRYVGYRSGPKGRLYCLRKRGKDWLERWQSTMPLSRYIQEIENVQRGE